MIGSVRQRIREGEFVGRAELLNLIDEIQKDHQKRREELGTAELFGTKVSTDHGETWNTAALCGRCIQETEPPTRIRKTGGCGARQCDWCGTYNELYKGDS